MCLCKLRWLHCSPEGLLYAPWASVGFIGLHGGTTLLYEAQRGSTAAAGWLAAKQATAGPVETIKARLRALMVWCLADNFHGD